MVVLSIAAEGGSGVRREWNVKLLKFGYYLATLFVRRKRYKMIRKYITIIMIQKLKKLNLS